jgi:hypothetical protein
MVSDIIAHLVSLDFCSHKLIMETNTASFPAVSIGIKCRQLQINNMISHSEDFIPLPFTCERSKERYIYITDHETSSCKLQYSDIFIVDPLLGRDLETDEYSR